MMKKSIAGIVAVGALCVLGYGWFSSSDAAGKQQAAVAFPPTKVATVTVTPSDLRRSISAIGTLEAVQQALISAEVNGRIEKLYFQAGQQVKKGDLLLQIDDAEEQADLERYRAQMRFAKKSLNRAKKLKGLSASQSRIDETQTEVDQSKANIAHTLAVIEKKRVEAPFDGSLGIRKVHRGEFVTPGTAIVTLTDTRQYFLNFSVAERLLPKISVGQAVELRVDAIPSKVFAATVSSIEPQVDQNTHTVLIQARLNDSAHPLYPGMFAHVSVQLDPNKQVLLLPETAVQTSTYGNSVYVVTKNERSGYSVTRVAVKTGQRQDGQVVIRQGISDGDTVVISGQNRLRDGAAVALKEAVSITPMTKSHTQT
jgi:membrane fusion protein, multidrug efflux system